MTQLHWLLLAFIFGLGMFAGMVTNELLHMVVKSKLWRKVVNLKHLTFSFYLATN